MKLHPSITAERISETVEESMFDLSSPGICVACGDDADGVEPDARKYKCHSCDSMSVYGAEELLFHVDC
jgi:hypothetical protein